LLFVSRPADGHDSYKNQADPYELSCFHSFPEENHGESNDKGTVKTFDDSRKARPDFIQTDEEEGIGKGNTEKAAEDEKKHSSRIFQAG